MFDIPHYCIIIQMYKCLGLVILSFFCPYVEVSVVSIYGYICQAAVRATYASVITAFFTFVKNKFAFLIACIFIVIMSSCIRVDQWKVICGNCR
jgi:hypothetical protein